MNDRKKHIIITVIIVAATIASIVCVNIGVGYYLRNNEFTDVYSYDQKSDIVRTTTRIDDVLGELEVLIPNTGSTKDWEKNSLDEEAVQIILVAVDIALIVVGVFAYRIVLSFKKQDRHETVSLFVLLGAFIVLAIIVIYCILNHFAHT